MLTNEANDYLVIDNYEPVTYLVAQRGQPYMDFTLPMVLRRPIRSKEQAPSGGVYDAADVVWHIPGAIWAPLLAAVGYPKEADVVQDGDGNQFTVLRWAGEARDGTRQYQWLPLETRNLIIAERLCDTIVIESCGAGALGASLVEQKTWRPAVTGLACRVQELTDEEKEERALRGTERRFEVYLSREVLIDPLRSRIPWPAVNSGYLDITGYKERARIDVLPVIEAVAKV